MPVRTEYQPGVCSCVIVQVETGAEAPCCGLTGPDAPFCELCSDRHRSDDRTKRGEIRVLARLRRRVVTHE